MTRTILAFALASSFFAPSAAAQDTTAVRTVVDAFFAALNTRDTVAMALTMTESVRLVAVDLDHPEKAPMVVERTTYFKGLTTGTDTFNERYWDPHYTLDAGIALFWAPYEFKVNGAFSHCGHNALDLVRTPEGWRISGGVFSMQRSNCP